MIPQGNTWKLRLCTGGRSQWQNVASGCRYNATETTRLVVTNMAWVFLGPCSPIPVGCGLAKGSFLHIVGILQNLCISNFALFKKNKSFYFTVITRWNQCPENISYNWAQNAGAFNRKKNQPAFLHLWSEFLLRYVVSTGCWWCNGVKVIESMTSNRTFSSKGYPLPELPLLLQLVGL